ncbi:MAG TPA: exopolysaccharide biosynthesis protein [Caulobacteraceae bacterium]|jgi:hypothetical protein
MPDKPASSVADNLKPLLETQKDKVSVGEIVARVEQGDGLAPVVTLLTLPVLMPLPPGVSMVLALPLLFAAPQMMIGRKDLWLPKPLACQAIDRDKLQAGVKKVMPWVERVERVVKPRLGFLTGRLGAVVAGAVCTVMAVVLVLPLPFANLFPALTVLLFSLGLTRRDGLAVIVGCVAMAIAVTAIVWGLHGARLGIHGLFG